MEESESVETLTGRLALVEERLASLEAAHAVGAEAAAKTADELDEDEFWALEGLKSRTPDRSAVLLTGAVRLPSEACYEWQETFDADSVLEADWAPAASALAALGQPVRLSLLRQVLSGVEAASELAALEGLGTTGRCTTICGRWWPPAGCAA